MHKVDPLARQVGKSSEVLGRREPLRLEAPHLTRRSPAPLRCFAADSAYKAAQRRLKAARAVLKKAKTPAAKKKAAARVKAAKKKRDKEKRARDKACA